jgi:hypothetical protein
MSRHVDMHVNEKFASHMNEMLTYKLKAHKNKGFIMEAP